MAANSALFIVCLSGCDLMSIVCDGVCCRFYNTRSQGGVTLNL